MASADTGKPCWWARLFEMLACLADTLTEHQVRFPRRTLSNRGWETAEPVKGAHLPTQKPETVGQACSPSRPRKPDEGPVSVADDAEGLPWRSSFFS